MPSQRREVFPTDRRVTIKDVAKFAGVSHTTVSLALRGSSRITEARRKEIQQAANRLGYRLNPMAAGLARYRQKSKYMPIQATIAWINFWDNPEEMRCYREFDLYWQGAEDVAARLGYRLEPYENLSNVSLERLTEILLSRNVKGILVPPHGGSNRGNIEKLLSLDWSRFSAVRIGYTVTELKAPTVASNQRANMKILLAGLRRKGYTRIGYVTMEMEWTSAFDGYMGDWIELPEGQRVSPLRLKTPVGSHSMELFEAWYRKNRPDAIILNIQEPVGWLKQLGLKIPDDLGVAVTSILDGGVDSGIDQHAYDIGKAAVEVLISRINDEDYGESSVQQELLIQGEWVEGTSV